MRRIIAKLRLLKNRTFLKEHNCHTWRQYNRDNDTDIIRYATLVSQFYHGYPYHVKFEEVPYSITDWMKWVKDMWDWCDKNCSDKFRYDIHRVIRERGLIHNQYNDTMIWSEIDDYSMNDVGGHDILFFAFKNEKDYTWFKLRWC